MLRAKYLLPLSVTLLGALAFALSSCGGKSGGQENQGPPFIGAELNSFPPGAAPPGFTSSAFVEILDSNDNSITNANVTMNGVPLAYSAADEVYEGNVVVAPGGAVSLSVTVGGNAYTASATQFTSYPTASVPASGATLDQSVANTVTWSGGAPAANAKQYGLGILDAGNPNNPLVWPANQFLQEIPLATTSFSIPAVSITGGNRLLIVGISSETPVLNAAPGSVLVAGGFNYLPITVTGMPVTNHRLVAGLLPVAVTWSGSQFVVVGGSGTILTSPDGTTWTTRRSGTSEFFGGIAWSGAQFAAVGLNGVILTSPDGISWTPRASGTSDALFDVAWSGTQFVAVGQGTGGTILSSPDGVTWTPRLSGTTASLNGVASSGTTTVAVGNGVILTSSDGAIWAVQGIAASLTAVTWSGTQFVAVGSTDLYLTSPDGVTWTPHSAGTAGNPRAVAWTGTEFVAVGGTGNSATIHTSPDGVTWTQNAPGTTNLLRGVASSGTKLVIVGTGNGGTILTSP